MPMRRRVSQTRWDWVIDHGTRFLGRLDLCGHWEARLVARNWIDPAANKAAKCGADADFLIACALHVAEIVEAVDKDPYKDVVWYHTQQGMRVRLGKAGGALARIKTIRKRIRTAPARQIKTLQQSWDRAKGKISQEPQPSELPVDRAFEACVTNPAASARGSVADAINQFLKMEPPAPQLNPRGRPHVPALMKLIVGMDEHLEKVTGFPQRKLLSELLGFPSMEGPYGKKELCGINTSPVTLALLIRQHRSRRYSTGLMTLKRLEQEWAALRRQMLAQG